MNVSNLIGHGHLGVSQAQDPISLLIKNLPCFLRLAPKHHIYSSIPQLQLIPYQQS